MNTRKLFKSFHEKGREEIRDLAIQFVEQDFFSVFPQLKNEVSILITGSVAGGFQDKNSDIDFVVFFQKKEMFEKYKTLIIKEFRNQNRESKKAPLELHGENIKLFEDVEGELSLWNKDWLLREIADAIILNDPGDAFENLQQKYSWYPDEIFREKMRWLFAEATFLIFDRYRVGMERKSFYYTESIKIKTLGLFLATLIMANHKYPKSEKHLELDVEKLKNIFPEIRNMIRDILLEKENSKIFSLLCLLRKEIEKLLLNRKIITKEDENYWIGLRPAYRVELEK